MPRCTPQIVVTDEQRATLEAAMQNADPKSDLFKRCITILESAAGTSAAQIEQKYDISSRSIQTYRNIFRSGGCEALLTFKPHMGRCGTANTLAIVRVKSEVSRFLAAGVKFTAKVISTILDLGVSTVKKALSTIRQEEGIEPQNKGPVHSKALSTFDGQDLELVGFYLSSDPKILAVSVYPTQDDQRTLGRSVHSISSSGVEITQRLGTVYKNQTLDLAMNSLLSYAPAQGDPLEPCDFVHSLKQDLEKQDAKLALIVCGEVPSELQQDPSITIIPADSFEDFTSLSAEVVRNMDDGAHASSVFKRILTRVSKQNADNPVPVNWRAFTASQPQREEPCVPQAAQTCSVITLETFDKDGNSLSVRQEFCDLIPKLNGTYGCKNVYELQSHAGKAEQGIREIVRSATPEFLQQFVSLGTLRKSPKLPEKKEDEGVSAPTVSESSGSDKKAKRTISRQVRVFEMETTIGRIRVVAPPTLDASGIAPRTRLWSSSLRVLTVEMIQMLPYRKLAWALNTALNRVGETEFDFRIINDHIQHWGEDIFNQVLDHAMSALKKNGFNPETGKPEEGVTLPNSITRDVVSKEDEATERAAVQKIIDDYRAEHPNFPELENPHNSITSDSKKELILQVDGVVVKGQKEHRKINGKQTPKPKTRLQVTTNAGYLRWFGGSYTIAAETTHQTMLIALGFMLENHLLEDRILVSFCDGESLILKKTKDMFSFHKGLRVFLDWYHVGHRLRAILSQAFYPGVEHREENNEIINNVLTQLWLGRIDDAMRVLQDTPEEMIRNKDKFKEACNYIEKHKSELYCYAARKIAGVTNSSNRVEQVNKILVSYRQKHKGMAWSNSGSHALAVLAALKANGHLQEWAVTGRVSFSPKIEPEKSKKKEAA